MIRSFKSKALKRYWTKNDASALRPDWIKKVRMVLSRLDASRSAAEMSVIGMKFHGLTGDKAGRFAVSVSPNWRITFGWDGEDAVEVDLEDYHG
jgi:proteic killer suppression protein